MFCQVRPEHAEDELDDLAELERLRDVDARAAERAGQPLDQRLAQVREEVARRTAGSPGMPALTRLPMKRIGFAMIVLKAPIALLEVGHHRRREDLEDDLQQAQHLLEPPRRRSRRRSRRRRAPTFANARGSSDDVDELERLQRGDEHAAGSARTKPSSPPSAPWNQAHARAIALAFLMFSQTSSWPISFMKPPISVSAVRGTGSPVIGSSPSTAFSRS